MFSSFTRVTGLSNEESREYRQLQQSLQSLLLDEIILQGARDGVPTLEISKALHNQRDERRSTWLPGIPVATVTQVHARINQLSQEGVLERFTVPAVVAGYSVSQNQVRLLAGGEARLNEVAREIEAKGLRYSELEQQHLSTPVPQSSLWNTFSFLFPWDRNH